MTWDPISKAVDYAIVRGYRTPGVCEVIGASRARRWNEAAITGNDGALLIYMGIKLSHFTLALHLYEDSDWQQWDVFYPVIRDVPRLGTTFGGASGASANPLGDARGVTALTIIHPVLAAVDIRQCVIESIDAPVQVDNGEWVISIQCIEVRQPKRAAGRQKAVAETPAAVDPWTALAERLEAENNAERLAQDQGNP